MFRILAIFCLLLPAAAAAQTPSSGTATLTVRVTDLPNDDGHVILALTKGSADYEDMDGEPFMSAIVDIRNGTATGTFKDVPYGDYAVRLFHDENDDEQIETNFIGIPTEAYGFSNNASGTFGPPSYEDARFYVKTPKKQITISVD